MGDNSEELDDYEVTLEKAILRFKEESDNADKFGFLSGIYEGLKMARFLYKSEKLLQYLQKETN